MYAQTSMSIRDTVLMSLLILALLVSIGVTYYKTVVMQDFVAENIEGEEEPAAPDSEPQELP